MEESEKRRERLNAIRMGAAQAKLCNSSETPSTPVLLSNPLIDTSATSPVQDNCYVTPRFDFYTHPMSAFSGNRRNNFQQGYRTSSGPRSTQLTHSSNHHFQNNFSPNQAIYQAQEIHNSPSAHMTALQQYSHLSLHQGTPGVWNGSAGVKGYKFSTGHSRSNISSPSFGRINGPCFSPGQVEGLQSPGSGWAASPSSRSVRGRGFWYASSRSPNMEPSARRERGPHVHARAEDKPELFYHTSMLEDPWMALTPVLWTADSSTSWLPKSISMKRARIVEARGKSRSKPSLAEFLSASMNEAVNDGSDC